MADAEPGDGGLRRELRLTTAVSVVVGIVIGSGIFVGANRVAGGVESVAGLFAVWIGAGLLTLLGALTYAEFGALYPRSGGDYVYVSTSLGPFWGFFTGWTSFALNLPASNAFLALAFAGQLNQLKPDAHATVFGAGFSTLFTAVGVLALFTAINYFGVRQGGLTQRILTFGKVGLTLILVAWGLFSSKSSTGNLDPFFGFSHPASNSLALALVAALFAYDGWNNVARLAGEIRDPQRVIPKALTAGVLSVIAIYVLVNLGYLLVLGLGGMAGDDSSPESARFIASRAADVLFGGNGERFVAFIIGVSILGTINGITLSGPRVYFAMARDGLFFPSIARVHPVHRTPHTSILLQGAISILLVLFVPFYFLQNYVVVAAWTAYSLTAIGLLRHRRMNPQMPRPYRVPLYPWVPLLFLVLALGFLGYLVLDAVQKLMADKPDDFLFLLVNVLVLVLAWPVYRFLRRRYPTPTESS